MDQLAGIDIYSPDTYVPGFPHDWFTLLREHDPVHFQPEPEGPGYWAVTKYEDVVRVSRDVATFSSEEGGTNIEDLTPHELETIRLMMLDMDPPRHTKLRNLVNKGFTPRMVGRLEEHVREISHQIIDKVAPLGECDFVTQIAAELPLQVIAEMVGVPQRDRHMVFDWSNKLIGFDDPEYQTSRDQASLVAAQMYAYANKLAEERKGEPGSDLVSVLMSSEIDGQYLTELEFDLFFILLTVAGNETTRNSISSGMLALMEHPEQRERLIADPSLMDTAVEEIVRWASPLIYFRRTATRDTELRGREIRAGQKVAMYYPSANRDEEVFPDGDVFDVGRSPNEHLGFGGGGNHFCLGANLARLEIKVMFSTLLERLPDMQPAGPARRLRSNFINGIKELPVRFTPS